jgi:hypothetical protein
MQREDDTEVTLGSDPMAARFACHRSVPEPNGTHGGSD